MTFNFITVSSKEWKENVNIINESLYSCGVLYNNLSYVICSL